MRGRCTLYLYSPCRFCTESEVLFDVIHFLNQLFSRQQGQYTQSLSAVQGKLYIKSICNNVSPVRGQATFVAHAETLKKCRNVFLASHKKMVPATNVARTRKRGKI